MVQKLTVCRIGAEWGFRDVTGTAYAQSSDIRFVVETAQQMAQRTGSHVNFSVDAEEHFRSATRAAEHVDSPRPAGANSVRSLRSFWERFVRKRQGK
ncbi:hypothetical protein ASE61_25690 [Bosea sp. Root670]|uniref:hypothetical protein n=1 Tax=Bosea sp. Root670 TaxID=1736583 RepID=UPI000715F881|nr:hypothetical protein [Bosea sp. Root670]KRE04324.1 hypothetical protein ASE61_25690 [Bosea sp. Root670]